MMIGSIGWTKEERNLGRDMVKQLAVFVGDDIDLTDWFDGKESTYGTGQISLWPEDFLLIARFILRRKPQTP